MDDLVDGSIPNAGVRSNDRTAMTISKLSLNKPDGAAQPNHTGTPDKSTRFLRGEKLHMQVDGGQEDCPSVAKTSAGPMRSSSMAVGNPPRTYPAGLQTSCRATLATLIVPLLPPASSTSKPRKAALVGMAHGPSRSSSCPIPPKASRCSRAAGSSNATSLGWAAADSLQRTERNPSKAQPHGRSSRPPE